jgi:hypothetical protein
MQFEHLCLFADLASSRSKTDVIADRHNYIGYSILISLFNVSEERSVVKIFLNREDILQMLKVWHEHPKDFSNVCDGIDAKFASTNIFDSYLMKEATLVNSGRICNNYFAYVKLYLYETQYHNHSLVPYFKVFSELFFWSLRTGVNITDINLFTPEMLEEILLDKEGAEIFCDIFLNYHGVYETHISSIFHHRPYYLNKILPCVKTSKDLLFFMKCSLYAFLDRNIIRTVLNRLRNEDKISDEEISYIGHMY